MRKSEAYAVGGDMKRREFIAKCGAGLASIITAGKAPAAIVKSLLSTKGTDFDYAPEHIENPYVTDGLMLMYDGIWNAGLGEHDEQSMVWKDLSNNGYDLTVRNSCYFTDAALYASPDRTSHDAAGTTKAFYPGDFVTVEIGYNSTGAYNAGSAGTYYFLFCGYYPDRYGLQLQKYGYSGMILGSKKRNQSFNCYTGGTSSLVHGTRAVQMAATFGNDSNLDFAEISNAGAQWQSMDLKFTGTEGNNIPTGVHVFGTSNISGSPRNQGWGSVYGYVYYIRVYDRVLSEEELMWNRALDEERFHLPR